MFPRATHLFLFLEIFNQEGGIQSYVKDLLAAYDRLPLDVSAEVWLLRDRPEVLPPRSAKLRFFGSLPLHAALNRLAYLLRLALVLLVRPPSQVYCGHINLAPLTQRLCQLRGIPYSVLTYGKEVWDPLPAAQRRALQGAAQVWTISRYSRDRLCASNGVDPQRVAMVPCIVDGEAFRSEGDAAVLANLRSRYGLAADDRVLLTVARLWPGDLYKGVDVTIRALPQILTDHSVKYLVIGRGDDRPRLEALAEELGVADRVIFAGFVPTADLADHYRLASAYVMPSQEGFGIVYLEAMACGVPVIAGDNDGSADPLQDGRLGWPVAHRDPHAVATACRALLAGGDRRCDGSWLREQALAAFGPMALTQQLQRAIEAESVGRSVVMPLDPIVPHP
jgi:glycosyltransferase involved in cell wall biosynthesis